jgi:hypothetical protein
MALRSASKQQGMVEESYEPPFSPASDKQGARQCGNPGPERPFKNDRSGVALHDPLSIGVVSQYLVV